MSDSKEDISDVEQLPVPSWKRSRNDDQLAELQQAVYWCRCVQVCMVCISHSFLHWSHSFSLRFSLHTES